MVRCRSAFHETRSWRRGGRAAKGDWGLVVVAKSVDRRAACVVDCHYDGGGDALRRDKRELRSGTTCTLLTSGQRNDKAITRRGEDDRILRKRVWQLSLAIGLCNCARTM